MPTAVTLIPNPSPKPEVASSEDYKAVKRKGEITVWAVTATEILRRSGDLYAVKPKDPEIVVRHEVEFDLEKMNGARLKEIALSLGIKLGSTGMKQQMPASVLREMIRARMAAIEIIDDQEQVTVEPEA